MRAAPGTPEGVTCPIPPTRLPFVNTEFAEVQFRGEPRQVTSIWGGAEGGRIFLIDPRTGDCQARLLPDGEPGAYMLKTGPDGRLYLGSGEGNLLRYDPGRDAFEILVKGQMSGITWGGCVTDRHVVWTASPGHACVYDWREDRLLHVLKPLDTERPEALYGHRAIECPDGKVLLGMNSPQARLVLLDPLTAQRRSVTPEAIRGQVWTRDATFLDPGTLGCFCGAELLVFRYPSFEPLGRVPAPPGAEHLGGRACFCAGRFHALSSPDGSLHRLAADRSGWELVRGNFAAEGGGILGALGDEAVCVVGSTGQFARLDLATGEVLSRELDALGPLGTHAFCPIPEIGRVFGAPFINQRFWQIELAGGRGEDLGRAAPGGGQVNGIVWDPQTRRVLMASYTTCSITAFDPARPAGWPENPRVLARAGHGQMRPKALVHDGRWVWMVSSPEYGHLGGALSRLDPRDGSIRVWPHLVRDQTPNAIVADPQRGRVYLSTEVNADCDSAPPTQSTARLVAFDTRALAIARELTPLDGCGRLDLLALLSPGRVLLTARGRLFAWRPEDGAFEDLGAKPAGMRRVAAAPDGTLYTGCRGQVGRLQFGDGGIQFAPLAPGDDRFLSVAGGRLWFVVGQEVRALNVG